MASTETTGAQAPPAIRDMTNEAFEQHYRCDRVTAEIIRNAFVMATKTLRLASELPAQ